MLCPAYLVGSIVNYSMRSFFNWLKPTSSYLSLIGGIAAITLGTFLFAWGAIRPVSAATSATYQVRDDQVGPSGFHQSSSNFSVDGALESIVGGTASTTFQAQLGSPVKVPTPSTNNQNNSGSSSSGNGVTSTCPAPTNFTVSDIECNRAYKSLIKISGTRSSDTNYILINEDLSGVHLASTTTWDKDVYLQPGQNTIVIYGKNTCDAKTPPITLNLFRARMGDTNDDNQTNDYDLSTFTRRWERKQDCLSDFNRDQITNDYDLSLLASSWNG